MSNFRHSVKTIREGFVLPPKCRICNHDQRQEIEQALIRGHSHRAISQQFTVSRGVVDRHLKHVSHDVKHVRELMEVEHGKSLLVQLRELGSQARYLGVRAKRAGDYRTALAAVRELTRILELEARLTGELNEKPETKILNLTLDADTARRMTETFLARHLGVNPT
jgi:hypothetical protein